MKEYCFGIDIGGTTVKCGLFNVKGDILEKWEIPTRTENNGVSILPDVAATIDAKIQEKGIARDTIAGVGVGIPGPVNEEGAVICAVNLHWGYVELEKELEKLTGLAVKAGNDANVAALGEMWKGGGAGYHNVVMVTLGTGVGGRIIVNGKIVTGTHGAGGEMAMCMWRLTSTSPATVEIRAVWSSTPAAYRHCPSGKPYAGCHR